MPKLCLLSVADTVRLPPALYEATVVGEVTIPEGNTFKITAGLDRALVAQLKQRSLDSSDTDIQVNTSDRERFGAGSYEKWYKKGRTPFALVERKTGALAALVWFGPKPLGRKSLKHLSPEELAEESNQPDTEWHTIVYRSYPPFRGQGLMKPFTKGVMEVYRRAFPDIRMWAGIHTDNPASIRFAKSLGFVIDKSRSDPEGQHYVLVQKLIPCPRVALFDLDDTLALTLEPLEHDMIERVLAVLERVPVAIVTGRDLARVGDDFLARISTSPHIDRFYLLTEGAAQCLQWDGAKWKEAYAESISPEECMRIKTAFAEAAVETGVLEGLPVFGEQFVQKRAMMAFAALGIGVPRHLKYSWDPGNVRREKLFHAIERKLPDLEVLMGGATSIDVTRKGVDKAYGVRWLSEQLRIAPAEMLYVGDALYPGGNDYVVIETGVATRPTTGPEETARIIDELLSACA